jgi:hypothetical protein
MRRFFVQRNTDASGVSGTGKVAEGCLYDNHWIGLVWLGKHVTLSFYPSIDEVIAIHGHGGNTSIVWIDDRSSNVDVNELSDATTHVERRVVSEPDSPNVETELVLADNVRQDIVP